MEAYLAFNLCLVSLCGEQITNKVGRFAVMRFAILKLHRPTVAWILFQAGGCLASG